MTPKVILDTGPLGLIVHIKSTKPEPKKCLEWLKSLISNNIDVYIPEVADYEVRRSLIRLNSHDSINYLNQLNKNLGYVPINTDAMLLAAESLAHAKVNKLPSADEKALDGDMVLVGQVKDLHQNIDGELIVATMNIKDFAHFVDARHWEDIDPKKISA